MCTFDQKNQVQSSPHLSPWNLWKPTRNQTLWRSESRFKRFIYRLVAVHLKATSYKSKFLLLEASQKPARTVICTCGQFANSALITFIRIFSHREELNDDLLNYFFLKAVPTRWSENWVIKKFAIFICPIVLPRGTFEKKSYWQKFAKVLIFNNCIFTWQFSFQLKINL